MSATFPSPQDDCFTILGVAINATPDDVRAAARRLTLKFHPDRFAAAGSDVQADAELASMLVSDAAKRLSDVFARATYILKHTFSVQLHDLRHQQPPADLFARILETQEALVDIQMGEPADRAALAVDLANYNADLTACEEQLWAVLGRMAAGEPVTADDIAAPLMLHGYLIRVTNGISAVLA